MTKKPITSKDAADKVVKNIRRKTRQTYKLAQAEANRAHIEAENSRSDALIALKLEKARLKAMPKIVSDNGQACREDQID